MGCSLFWTFIALKKAGKSVLTLESRRGLRQMDLLLFSVSFENDFLNVLKMLALSGIPLRSHARGRDYPLVGAGGAAVQINPETLSPFMDFFARIGSRIARFRRRKRFDTCSRARGTTRTQCSRS